MTLAAAALLLAFVVGAAGTTSLSFTVQLSGPAKAAATVSYATANATAIAPADFGATSGACLLERETGCERSSSRSSATPSTKRTRR